MIVPAPLLFQFQLSAPRLDAIPRPRGKLLDLPPHAELFTPFVLQHHVSEPAAVAALRRSRSSELEAMSPGAVGADMPQSPLSLRLAWNTAGLGLDVTVRGRRQPLAGRRSDLRHSDHLQIFVDTRHTGNVHRATEYCTALIVLPSDEDHDDEPTVAFVEIAQQRTTKRERSGKSCSYRVHETSDGYRLELWIPAAQLPGFAEAPEIGHIGFYLVVEDTVLGQLPLSIGGDFPVSYDPSTWLQVRLLPGEA